MHVIKKYNFNNIIPHLESQIVNLDDFNNSKLREKIKIYCGYCNNIHFINKKVLIHHYLKQFNNKNQTYKQCCSIRCSRLFNGFDVKSNIICKNCAKYFIGIKSKFCNKSCAATYNNNIRKQNGINLTLKYPVGLLIL